MSRSTSPTTPRPASIAGTLTLEVGRADAGDRRHADGLGLHPPRSPELPARDELLRPAGQRARLLPAGPPAPDGPQPRPLLTQRRRRTTGCAPAWDGKRLDWSAWDRRFGPLLRRLGLRRPAAQGRSRSSASTCRCYENWPTPIEGNYNGDYWADRAFTRAYRRDLRRGRRGSSPSTSTREGWDDTLFQCFLNGKVDFKRERLVARVVPLAARRAGELPGLLGPPLLRPRPSTRGSRRPPGRAEAGLPRRHLPAPVAARRARRPARLQRRRRGACGRYRRMVLDRKDGPAARSSSSTAAATRSRTSNVQPAAWSLDAWSLGADGVLPWQTIGTADSWKKADELSLFYPGRGGERPRRSPRSASRRTAGASRTSST